MPKQTSTGMYQESRYIVDNQPGASPYATIQSALDDANAAGIAAVVLVRPGTYNESLILYSDIDVQGATAFGEPSSLVINGIHTPPLTGTVTFENVTLQSPTHIFSSAAAGTAQITLKDCSVDITNGYTFNLPNWTGTFIANNVGQLGVNNGEINNTAGASIFYTNVQAGSGTLNIANISGFYDFFNVSFECQIRFRGTSSGTANGGCWFQNTITLNNTASIEISNGFLQTGVNAAINTTSTSVPSVTLSNTTIDSSAANIIIGTGTINISDCSFVSGKNIQSTITQVYLPVVGRISPYVVGTTGNFSTIQAAINAANSAGKGTVFIQPGTYNENLILFDSVDLFGAVGVADTQTCLIVGKHTPPNAGSVTIRNIFLQSATHVLDSAAAGTATLILIDDAVSVTNGYTFNLPNWTGTLVGFDIGEAGSVNDGWINNTAGAVVFMTNVTIGKGSGNSMICSGSVELYNCVVQCPVNFITGSSVLVDGATLFTNALTLSNNSTGTINNSSISSGASASITMSSTAAWTISNCTLTSSNNPCIAGAGIGTLSLYNVTHTDNSVVAGTLTVVNGGLTDIGSIRSNFTQHSLLLGQGTRGTLTALGAATNGQIPIGSTGLDPVLASLTPGQGIAITDGAGSISIGTTGTLNQQQIFYVGKHGNNALDGLSIQNAKLTFGAAITAASALTPSAINRFSIVCLDDGIYTEDIVAASFVDIFAPNATIVATATGLTVADNSNVTFLAMQVPDAAFGVVKGAADTDTSWVNISEVTCAGSAVGFANISAAGGALLCEWKTLSIEDGVGVGDITSSGHIHVRGGDIYITGLTGNAIALGRALSGSLVGHVDHILCEGIGATGIALFMAQGTIDVNVNSINCTTAISVDGTAGSCILNLFCNSLIGSQSVTNGAISNIWTPPTYPANQAGMLDGQLVIGSTGVNPVVASLTPGANISITPGAGTITISASAGGLTWAETTVDAGIVVNNGYIANKVGLLTMTLPATAAIGDTIRITGINTAVGWRIAQNANQVVHFGILSTTPGAGGYIQATAIRDSAELVCVVAGASTEYNVISSIGNITVV